MISTEKSMSHFRRCVLSSKWCLSSRMRRQLMRLCVCKGQDPRKSICPTCFFIYLPPYLLGLAAVTND